MYKVALGAVLLLFIHMWVKEVLREEENNEKRKQMEKKKAWRKEER